jgi:hypothetical protein
MKVTVTNGSPPREERRITLGCRTGSRRRTDCLRAALHVTKWWLMVAVSLLLGVLNGVGAWAALTSTASVSASYATGTVVLADDDAGAAILSLSDAALGATATGCIQVTYSGTLTANVHLYGSTSGTGLDPYLDLVVTRGTISTGAFPSCANFSPDPTDYLGSGNGVIYSGTLANFVSTHTDYASGLVDPTAGAPAAWTNPTTRAYKLSVTVQNNSTAEGKNTTSTFTWEARQR